MGYRCCLVGRGKVWYWRLVAVRRHVELAAHVTVLHEGVVERVLAGRAAPQQLAVLPARHAAAQ